MRIGLVLIVLLVLPLATALEAPRGTISVDADSSEWSGVAAQPIAESNEPLPSEQDLSGSFKTVWDQEYLYFFVDVTDDEVDVDGGSVAWDHDNVQFLLDGGNEKSEDYDDNDHRFAVRADAQDMLIWSQGSRNTVTDENIIAAARQTADGYELEVGIGWDEIGGQAPAQGVTYGFTLNLVDRDQEGIQDNLMWRYAPYLSWDAVWADLTLAGSSSTCGDGVRGLGEQCDDGNVADGDWCTSTCQVAERASSGFTFADAFLAYGQDDQSQDLRVFVDDTAVYDTGYYSLDGGASWQEFSLSGQQAKGRWVLSSAASDITIGREAASSSADKFVAVFSCTWSGGWDCHDGTWQTKKFSTSVSDSPDGVCGDGIIEGAEQCEPGMLSGKTCSDVGFDSGDLSCDPVTCDYDTSACTSGSRGTASGDRAVLEGLYASTNGDSWTDNSNWLSERPLGEWAGVETDAEGRVTRLDLFNNSLRGQLPDDLGALSELRYLNTKQNRLTGPLPSTIDELDKVEELMLSGVPSPKDWPKNPPLTIHPGKQDESTNTFTGDFPDDFFNLPNLMYLELSGTNLTGEYPETLGNAANLRKFSLSYNEQMVGTIPESIGNLVKLEQMHFSRSNLTGPLPDSISNLASIRKFSLSIAHDKGPFPDLSEMPYLREVVLSGSEERGRWAGPFPGYLINGSTPSLCNLFVAGNNWETPMPDDINVSECFWTFQVSLNLDKPLNGHFDFEPLVQAPGMINFDVAWNNLTGSFPPDLRHLTRIRNIGANNNHFEGPWPELDWTNKQQLRNSNGDIIHPLREFRRARFSNNKFVYADMLVVSDEGRTLFDWYQQEADVAFWYDQQRPFGWPETVTLSPGETFMYDYSHKTHEDDVDQWYKDGEPLDGQTSPVLTIESVSASDAGEYTLQKTNPNIPDLGPLESEPVTLVVE